MKRRLNELLEQAVPASLLKPDGRYTAPRSWGVYRITPGAPSSTALFHNGNHPVRQRELEQEYPAGPVEVIRLFPTKELAVELTELLNAVMVLLSANPAAAGEV